MSGIHARAGGRRGASRRGGFSLVESLVALGLTATLGAALLLAAETSAMTSGGAVDSAIANGIAEQLLDETAGKRYAAVGSGPRQWPLGPAGTEGPHRGQCDDLDDVVGMVSQPPCDAWGAALGQEDVNGALRHPAFRLRSAYFANWSTRLDVYYVSGGDFTTPLASGQTSFHRVVRARVFKTTGGQTRTLADQKRVFSHVPPP